MAETNCGFITTPDASAADLLTVWGLTVWGPTLLVNIGFDSLWVPGNTHPIPGITNVNALVDTGAGESCIDDLLATQLNLPIIDQKPMSGIGGAQMANIYLAQIHIPALNFNIYGAFAGVHLQAGGQPHMALIGRTFLNGFIMEYDGKTGSVILRS